MFPEILFFSFERFSIALPHPLPDSFPPLTVVVPSRCGPLNGFSKAFRPCFVSSQGNVVVPRLPEGSPFSNLPPHFRLPAFFCVPHQLSDGCLFPRAGDRTTFLCPNSLCIQTLPRCSSFLIRFTVRVEFLHPLFAGGSITLIARTCYFFPLFSPHSWCGGACPFFQAPE